MDRQHRTPMADEDVRERSARPATAEARAGGEHWLGSLQHLAGNRAVAGLVAAGRARGPELPRQTRDVLPGAEEDEEEGESPLYARPPETRDRTEQDRHPPGPDGGTTTADAGAPADAGTPAATTPTFPTRATMHADGTVGASITAAWTASTTDFAERFAWVTWNATSGAFSIVGPSVGTWEGVTPPARPTDSAPTYHVGEYHLHPPLPPGKNSALFPVGPSSQDRSAATSDDSPGVVRDFTTTARTVVTNYEYGPARRTQARH